MTLQNELHTRITLDRRWTYTRLKNRSSPKGGHGNAIWKKLCACDTLKINASVKWQNWGSANMSIFSRVNERVKCECEVQAMNWVKWTLVKNSNDQQFCPHTTIKKAKGNESWWPNGLGDPNTMPEKAKWIWTRCHGKLKETKCNAGKYQEIRARCKRRDRIRASTGEYETDRGSNSGEYWIIQDRKDSIQASTEKRSYMGEYRKMVESGWVSENGRFRASTGEEIVSEWVLENTR